MGGYQKFDYKAVLGSCGDFPYGYVGEKVKPCIFFKLNNIWGWEPKPVQCGDKTQIAADGEPFDECPKTLTKHLESAAAREAKDKDICYHSPLVAIQVEPETAGQLVHMECRAYYRGVKHDKKDKLGLVQFEVQVL